MDQDKKENVLIQLTHQLQLLTIELVKTKEELSRQKMRHQFIIDEKDKEIQKLILRNKLSNDGHLVGGGHWRPGSSVATISSAAGVRSPRVVVTDREEDVRGQLISHRQVGRYFRYKNRQQFNGCPSLNIDTIRRY
ncbi:hypothetical protein HDE_12245 [Halotydeus destructor]|nr:hypothetical protein HDE_12245 [Halotydeus destructor]